MKQRCGGTTQDGRVPPAKGDQPEDWRATDPKTSGRQPKDWAGRRYFLPSTSTTTCPRSVRGVRLQRVRDQLVRLPFCLADTHEFILDFSGYVSEDVRDSATMVWGLILGWFIVHLSFSSAPFLHCRLLFSFELTRWELKLFKSWKFQDPR